MKILLFITGLGMGGAEKVVCELADNLYQAGHEVKIVYFVGGITKRPINKQIGISKIPLDLKTSIFKSLHTVIKVVDDFKPDVLHSHMFHANIMARYVKIFRKKLRIICSSHSNYEGGKLRMKIYSLTENLCDVHTNVSDNAAKALMKAGAVKNKKIIAVYNGIDTNKYKFDEKIRFNTRKELDFDESAKVILTIGRIDVPKDYPTLLKAFKIVRQNQENTFLLVVGDGPKRKEIEDLSKNLGIYKYVKFLGLRGDIPALLSACDLFVSSSAWEGFGLAILEAMLCQRPIVATATDGARELLQQKMVEIGNEGDLAQDILSTLNKKEKNIEYIGVEKFNWHKILKIWLHLYQHGA